MFTDAENSTCKLAPMWFLAIASAAICSFAIWRVLLVYWWMPTIIQRALERQGIRGQKYRLFYGDTPEFAAMMKDAQSRPMVNLSHDIMPRVLPHYARWSKLHGQQFVHWYSSTPRLTLPDPEVAREVLSNKSGHLDKRPTRLIKDFLGNSLATLQGEAWILHRRIVSPAFHKDKLKDMIPTILESANNMFDKWQRLVSEVQSGGCEIEVSEEFRTLTADIIARTAFGSSYKEGKHVFDLQQEQQVLFAQADRTVYIPGSRFLPTRRNRHRWAVEKEVRGSLRNIIHSRLNSVSVGRGDLYGNDLLGMLLTANKQEYESSEKNLTLSIEDIIDECKTFFFAGHDTTSSLLTWTTMLLAHHSYWQEQARAEVLTMFGAKPPTMEGLNHLKIVTMVLNESLRLYPPALLAMRHAHENVQLGNLDLPKGTGLIIPILAIHHSPDLWGDDAKEFKPERFAAGVAKAAKHPLAFMPFSAGPRFCVGQNFALLEAKLVVTVMLQRFIFHLSPAYRHAPRTVMILSPQYGMQIMVERLGE